MAANATLRSIGQVLASLKSEFPDISISKIRFLESVGLLAPERAPSGYRRYRPADVERLRYILRIQKTQYLPLKVIKDHLEQLDRGVEPPRLASAPSAPKPAPNSAPNSSSKPKTNGSKVHQNHSNPAVRPADSVRRPADSVRQQGTAEVAPARPGAQPSVPDGTRQMPRQIRLSRSDLLQASGLTDSALAELESIQVIVPRRGTTYYGREALAIAVAARRLAVYGIDSRHLRAFKLAADREIGLVEQAIAPHLRARVKDGNPDVVAEVTQLVIGVHAALIRTGMEH